jgi:membrane protein
MFDKAQKQLEQRLFNPQASTPRLGLVALRLLRYPYAIANDIARGELTLRAMSLVYTTLLSIVPLLALVFSILKGLGYHRDFEPVLFQFLEPMGDKGIELTAQIMRFVDNARGDVLGSLGIAFFLYTAISMIQKVEASFNHVWRVQKPRSIGRRISEYLSVLMVGPVLIITALGLMASIVNYRLVQYLIQFEPFSTLILWVGKAAPYLLVAAAFTFLYAFVPNTKVKLRAALMGGIIASILWVGSGLLFTSFVSGASRTVLIYAGFAIVILALVWLHISWLVLLIGAQLAFYIQHPQCLRPGANVEHLTAALSERLALSIMYLLGKDFVTASPQRTAKHFKINSLAERLFVAVTTLDPIVRRLELAGLIVVTDDDFLLPGRDLEIIALNDVLDAVRRDPIDGDALHIRSVPEADVYARNAEDAMRASVSGKTLRDLVGE